MIERERERQRHRRREKQAPCWEPDVGLDPGIPGSRPGPKAGTKPLSHPGIPLIGAIVNGIVFLISLSAISLVAYRNATISVYLVSCKFTKFIYSNFLVESLMVYLVCYLQVVTVLLFPHQFGCLLFLV